MQASDSSDVIAIAVWRRSGDLRHVLGLRTTEYLVGEDQWAPWFAADQTLAYVSRMLSKTLSFGKYKVYHNEAAT